MYSSRFPFECTIVLFCVGHAESLIKRGGLYVNLARVDSGLERVDMAGHLLVGNMTILRVGKLRH